MYSVAFLVVLVAAYFLLPRLFSWFNKRIRQSELQRLHLDNAWRIRHFNSQLKAIPGDFKKQAQQKLEELKRNTPSTVWQELENRFKQMDSDFASCTEQLEAGTKLHVSSFKSAEEVRVYLNTVGRILHRLQFFPYAIEKRLKEMRRSEEKSGELLGILSESIQRASELIKHEDVRYNTRKLLVQAQKYFDEGRELMDQELINWLTVCSHFTTAHRLLKETVSGAEEDKEEASEQRQIRNRIQVSHSRRFQARPTQQNK